MTKYIEVILAKDRKGRTVTSMRMPMDSEVIDSGKTKVVSSSYGHVVLLDFATNTATYWRPGTPGDRKKTDIIYHDLDNEEN